MVSINLISFFVHVFYYFIYIPLWYLLITEPTGRGDGPDVIYIPLWYLLILRQILLLSRSWLNLHSTMVSINHVDLPTNTFIIDIYIPLWYLLIVNLKCQN